MLRSKEVPEKTLDNLLPPNRNYTYFQGAVQAPFNYAAKQFDPVNASWLADAALLVYADDAEVRKGFEQAGIKTVQPFQGKGTQCYVASTDHFVIVAFRGTQVMKKGEPTRFSEVLRDWMTDAKILLVGWRGAGAVHKGFRDALDEVWDDRDGREGLKSHLDKLGPGSAGKTLWFTGHSLGAALATLAATRYGQAAGVYTFGSPSVGNRAFVDSYKLPLCRYVNGKDFVTRALMSKALSWFFNYGHVGAPRFTQPDDSPRSEFGPTFWERYLPGFADHAPMFYAIYIWNTLVKERSKAGPGGPTP